MSDAHDATPPPPAVRSVLEPDEELRVDARAGDLSLVLTDRRVVIADDREITLDFPYQRLRRVELNVERGRPATLVLVPVSPDHKPHVLSIPNEELQSVAAAIALIGERLADG